MDSLCLSLQRANLRRIANASLLVLLVCLSSSSFATPDQANSKDRNYYFEFLTFRCSDPTRTFLEVFCQVPLRTLTYAQEDDGAEAGYDIAITLFNRETWHANVLNYRDSVVVNNKIKDENPPQSQLVRFSFLAEPGDYVATVKVTDRETQTYFSFDHRVDVPDYHFNELQVSDLQVSTFIKRSDKSAELVKNGRFIQPNVSHLFETGHDFLYLYSEIYNLSLENTTHNEFEATYTILDQSGNALRAIPYLVKKPGSSSAISVAMPIEDLPSGNYRVVLDVKDLDNGEVASTSANIIVVGPDANYLVDRFQNSEVRNRGAEMGETNTVELAHNEHSKGVKRWQKGEDLGAVSRNNAAVQSEYSQRRAYANKHFFNADGEGWESDQGRVYLQNGPPTNIDRISSGGGNQIYEVWEYSDLNRSYLFIDEWGKGHFRLLKTSTPAEERFNSRSGK